VEGGAVWVDEWEHLRTKLYKCYSVTKPAEAAFETGWAALGTLGYAMRNFRVEVEGGYRTNEIESYEKNGRLIDPMSGELTEISAMLNVLYDLPLSDDFSLSVGVGAGGDHVDINIDTSWHAFDHQDWRFAYQGLAGVNFALTRNLAMFANYRYLYVDIEEFQATPALYIDGEDLQKHTASLGLRYSFAPPAQEPPLAPPPPPQPAAPVEREFLVFFGFNKSVLTPQALETVRQAATAATQMGTANIRVVGHTDRSGSLSYNKALSLRRAEVVKKALVAEGVMGSAISLRGRGESEPLVQTADGMREPQNRRVQITF
jgi:outer membrane protein OmpA-like peptidoglycan-associated protein